METALNQAVEAYEGSLGENTNGVLPWSGGRFALTQNRPFCLIPPYLEVQLTSSDSSVDWSRISVHCLKVQEDGTTETIDVRVANLDIIASDEDGAFLSDASVQVTAEALGEKETTVTVDGDRTLRFSAGDALAAPQAETLQQAVEQAQAREKLQKQIDQLKSRMRKEKQLAKQMEIRRAIQRLEKEMYK